MPETLTPRERVAATLSHREPDRVPVTLGGSANHLSEERFDVLRAHFGFEQPARRTLVGFYTTPDYNPLLERLKTDFRFLHIRPVPSYIPNAVGPGFREFVDEWGLRHRLLSGYYDLAGAPLAKDLADLSVQRIESFPWPDPCDPARVAGLREEAEDLYNNTSYALVGHRPVYGNLWEMTRLLIGMENALMLTVTDTKMFDYLMGKLSEVLDGFYEVFLDAVGPYIQVIEFADDYGTNVGPMFNPEVYRKYMKPHYRKTIDMIKRKAPHVKALLHCDGAIRRFLPDLIETGFEVLNPIEWHLPGMDPVGLKRDFGKDMVFNGGVDVKHVLTQGTVEDVRREVRLRIEQMGKDGGYILAPAHNFTNDMPLENLLAFFEAGQELGFYPLSGVLPE